MWTCCILLALMQAGEKVDDVWAKFDKAEGKDKMGLGFDLAKDSKVDAARRAKLKAYFLSVIDGKVKFDNQFQAQLMAKIALAHLDEPELERNALEFAHAGLVDKSFLGGLDPTNLVGMHYLKDRGGNAYLVRCLDSNEKGLRKIAWTILELDEKVKGKVTFDPVKQLKEQKAAADELKKLLKEEKPLKNPPAEKK